MSRTTDGGWAALSGFYYQMAGASGLIAWAHCSDPSLDSKEQNAFVTWVRDGELQHEFLDSDLGIRKDDESGLAQFKFSRTIPPEEIYPGDLVEILESLHQTADKAATRGHTVTWYALVSNRPLSSGSADMRQAALVGDDHLKLRNEHHRAILQQLVIISDAAISRWVDALNGFARLFGVEENEIRNAIERLIGRIFRGTADHGGAQIAESDLVEVFTGCTDARPLLPGSVAGYTMSRLLASRLNPDTAVIRRGLLSAIARATSTNSLVVLCGSGGCGKTVALWQWAQELVSSTPPGSGAFTSITPACDLGRYWFAEEISDQANLAASSPRREEDPDRALDRLRIANADAKWPILHLGIDGLDEQVGLIQRELVKQALEWFRQEAQALRSEGRPPKATLVITCRDDDEIQRNWLRDPSGFGDASPTLETVAVGDFTQKELEEAAMQTGLPELYSRIVSASRFGALGEAGLLHEEAGRVSVDMASTMGSADERILHALRHPAMWRSFMKLPAPVRHQALDGHQAGMEELARTFVRRFLRKLSDRGQALELPDDQMLYQLHRVAAECAKTSHLRHSYSEWVDAAFSAGMISRQQAQTLFREAISGGLIALDDAIHWHWRHQFVGEYLSEPHTVD